METEIGKCRNSLALRISASMAKKLLLSHSTKAEIFTENNQLIIKPKDKARPFPGKSIYLDFLAL